MVRKRYISPYGSTIPIFSVLSLFTMGMEGNHYCVYMYAHDIPGFAVHSIACGKTYEKASDSLMIEEWISS